MADEPPLVLKAQFGAGVAQVHVTGDLDLTTAPALADMLAVALDRQPGWLVVNLRGVSYLDCAAARVIAEAAQALPGHQLIIRNPAPIVRRLLELTGVAAVIDDGPALQPALCGQPAGNGQTSGNGQTATAARGRASRRSRRVRVVAAPPATHAVIVRAARPAATRPLRLTGLNSADPAAPQVAARHGIQLVQQARMNRARMAGVRASIRVTAGQLASTGDQVAATFARMAELHPDDAGRLSALSAAAQEFAARSRRHAARCGR